MASNMNKVMERFTPCPFTCVSTKSKTDDDKRRQLPRVCRYRSKDRQIGLYFIVDPIDSIMVASDISANLLFQHLINIDFTDEQHLQIRMEIYFQNMFFDLDHRLLQMTFDRTEEKIAKNLPFNSGAAEKILPSIEEADSGCFAFAAVTTKTHIYIAYVGTIRAILIYYDENGDLVASDNRPQFYRDGSLHTILNDDERLRLKKLDVDETFAQKNSKYTRCVGKLCEKLLSSTVTANDLTECKCNPLSCEPAYCEIPFNSKDYALVILTDNIYQMYLKTGICEDDIPKDIIRLMTEKKNSMNSAEIILSELETKYYRQMSDDTVDSDHELQQPHFDYQHMGMLIHYFYHPEASSAVGNSTTTTNIPKSIQLRPDDGEITFSEINKFIATHDELQKQRIQKTDLQRSNSKHEYEVHLQNGTIESYVNFDKYEKLLSDNPDLNQTIKTITALLEHEGPETLLYEFEKLI
ncbi:unnamed protein product [Didymodactylos carnosus]|uniref:PPM-type phosphatase domain-containing protein n=1 Tax=Didymodactylos carnosus TaxID=1234261 RepID=A0A813PXV1_9BILA|nr:unnamed protein product [Didymodactylos carnosus]CAF0760751.1 unnamed protein product [Didymodactylos carnosus]CAF3504377.1 unnamed protein product [Didymodactylos carnosus]CAF3541589.1 unnamed protein product [Didymodactylos carnosus]